MNKVSADWQAAKAVLERMQRRLWALWRDDKLAYLETEEGREYRRELRAAFEAGHWPEVAFWLRALSEGARRFAAKRQAERMREFTYQAALRKEAEAYRALEAAWQKEGEK